MTMDDGSRVPWPAEPPDGDGLSFAAYSAARERFLARLGADSELGRLEQLWAMPAATGEHVTTALDDPPGSAERSTESDALKSGLP
jgi:hypothetical protein